MHSNLLNPLFLAIALTACVFCTIQANTAADESQSDFPQERPPSDWEDLFDGKTMHGWKALHCKQHGSTVDNIRARGN